MNKELIEKLNKQTITLVQNVYTDIENKLNQNATTDSRGIKTINLNDALMSLRSSRATVLNLLRKALNVKE